MGDNTPQTHTQTCSYKIDANIDANGTMPQYTATAVVVPQCHLGGMKYMYFV